MKRQLLGSIEFRESLEASLASCKHIKILTAYVTQSGVNWLLKNISENVSVLLVGRFEPADFINGASSFSALRAVIDAGHKVKILRRLHSKLVMLDESLIYIGSANLTANGLGLSDDSNLEIGVMLNASLNDVAEINRFIETSIELGLEHIDEMEKIINPMVEKQSSNIILTDWPVNIFSKAPGNMFVKELPISPPGEYSILYNEEPTLDFARIYANRNSFHVAKQIFVNSISYKWLTTLLSNESDEFGLAFGFVTKMLHDSIVDDPAPYRRTVKEIQNMLYSYCKLYCTDSIEFHTPGGRSEFVKLIR